MPPIVVPPGVVYACHCLLMGHFLFLHVNSQRSAQDHHSPPIEPILAHTELIIEGSLTERATLDITTLTKEMVMAKLSSTPFLNPTELSNSDRVTLIVTGNVKFEPGDINDMKIGHRFKVSARMFGDDGAAGPSNGDDDLNITLRSQEFTGNQGSAVSYRLTRTVDASKLNEDTIGGDEIYALVTLTKDTLPGFTIDQRASNVVEEGFGS